jgi:hypothetical protein
MIGFGRMGAAPGGTSDHALLSNLSYAAAGHTGFSPDTHVHDYMLLSAISEPSVGTDKVAIYVSASGASPNRQVELRAKFQDGSIWPIAGTMT